MAVVVTRGLTAAPRPAAHLFLSRRGAISRPRGAAGSERERSPPPRHLLQPCASLADRPMHWPPQLRLHFLELRPHAVAPALPLDLELAGAGFSADLGDGSCTSRILGCLCVRGAH